MIIAALTRTSGMRAAAAHLLGVSPRTLARRLANDPALLDALKPVDSAKRIAERKAKRAHDREFETQRCYAKYGARLREADRLIAKWRKEDDRPVPIEFERYRD